MRHDYVNFGFDDADLIIAVGYELPGIRPGAHQPQRGQADHPHSPLPAEVDAHYSVDVGISGDISASLDAVRKSIGAPVRRRELGPGAGLFAEELARGRERDSRFPLAPQRMVADARAALDRDDMVLVDAGAAKMWIARLYPTYERNTCLVSNGLSTMAFALPGALGVELARPEAKVLAVMGDGTFLMTSQEIETAVRERIPLVVLIWEDDGSGLIEWKIDLELGDHYYIGFSNPDVVKYAESFGAKGYQICSADELFPACVRRWPTTECRSSPAPSTTREACG